MILITLLIDKSLYISEYTTVKHKVLICVINILFIIIVPFFINFFDPFSCFIDNSINNIIRQIKNNKKKIILFSIVNAGIVFICIIMYKLLMNNYEIKGLFQKILFLCVLLILINLFYFFRQVAYSRVEILFSFVAFTIGITFIIISPNHLRVSWDDQIHYIRSATVSDLIDNTRYNAEMDYYNSVSYMDGGASDEILDDIMIKVENEYRQKINDQRYDADLGLYSIAYIPAATGMIIGKALNLSFLHVCMVARICNLTIYILIMYFAIKKLKYGKVLLSTIGLTTTTLFLASSFSYDFWVTAFCYLGFSCYISELQFYDRKIKNSTIILMIISLFLAFLPKAIYFVLLFGVLFMPKEKFVSKRQHIFYCMLIGVAVALLMLSFIVPMLFTSSIVSDTRGGGDVNGVGQVKHILNNPLWYIKLLVSFLKDYLNLDNAGGYISSMAYLGNGNNTTIILVVIGILTFLDRDDRKIKMFWVRGAFFISALCTITLVATALYISFTPVGNDVILGCQPRYIMPLLFPTLFFLGVNGIKLSINKNVMTIITIGITTLVFMNNIWLVCI